MYRALELVRRLRDELSGQGFGTVSVSDYPNYFRFLDDLLIMVSPETMINNAQEAYLDEALRGAIYDASGEALVDMHRDNQQAMQIATWINGVHVANHTQ